MLTGFLATSLCPLLLSCICHAHSKYLTDRLNPPHPSAVTAILHVCCWETSPEALLPVHSGDGWRPWETSRLHRIWVRLLRAQSSCVFFFSRLDHIRGKTPPCVCVCVCEFHFLACKGHNRVNEIFHCLFVQRVHPNVIANRFFETIHTHYFNIVVPLSLFTGVIKHHQELIQNFGI